MPRFTDDMKYTVLGSYSVPAAPPALGTPPVPVFPGTSTRDRERLLQGTGAVLSLRRAAELLPWDDAPARAWLRAQGLVHKVNGKEIVVWEEVLDRLKEQGTPATTAVSCKTHRGSGGQSVPRAPRTFLPGWR